ncbi:glycosyltransferase family 2 protein [Selenomonas sp. KH1T6]|uniref:glycosyltransferase family 2 protein n=1 Tax=Selenomonas sp. KH1T6 TaxID=3158784 RepID=UPI0008A759D6|nr:Glycosyltransferase involved in cell wall bisynthesis [Selenomonas ruminantium]
MAERYKEKCRWPFISIIIPVYNVEPYLSACLDSLLQQNFQDWEAVCVEDCSTDNSLAVLKKYAELDDRILVVSQTSNGGLARARNTGLDNAKGKYVCYLDSDDTLAKDSLSRLIPYLEKEHLEMLTYEVESVIFDIHPEGIPNDVYKMRHDYSKLGLVDGRKYFVEMSRNGEFLNNVVLALYDKKWLKRTGIRFQDGMYYEDGPYILACYLACHRMRHVNVGVYVRRYRVGSTTTGETNNYRHAYSRLWNYGAILELSYKTPNLSEEVENCLLFLAERWLAAAKAVVEKLSDDERLLFDQLKGFPHFWAKSAGILEAKIDKNMYLRGFEASIANATRIILYGAGKIGREMLSYLSLTPGIVDKVIFVESDKRMHTGVGCPIYAISEVSPASGDVIVLSVAYKHQRDMRKNAEKYGFKEIIAVDVLLLEAIRSKLVLHDV